MAKRALVLAGGGSHGAFQAGVIMRLVEAGHSWDIISGVSVGAINAACMAMYAPGKQVQGAKDLREFWYEISGNSSVYKSWTFGVIEALWRGGMHNTSPLDAKLRKVYKPESVKSSGVKLMVGAVALGSGKYKSVPSEEKDFVSWIMASAAMPAIFPPVKIDGDLWVDGGVRNITPLGDVIDQRPDEIDVVLCDPRGADPQPKDPKEFGNVLTIGARVISLLADEVFATDLDFATKAVRVYAPEKRFEHDSFDFDPKKIRTLIEYGYELAGKNL